MLGQSNSRSGFQGLRNLSQLSFLDIEGKNTTSPEYVLGDILL